MGLACPQLSLKKNPIHSSTLFQEMWMKQDPV